MRRSLTRIIKRTFGSRYARLVFHCAQILLGSDPTHAHAEGCVSCDPATLLSAFNSHKNRYAAHWPTTKVMAYIHSHQESLLLVDWRHPRPSVSLTSSRNISPTGRLAPSVKVVSLILLRSTHVGFRIGWSTSGHHCLGH